jgi:predicted DCC family thiol-disulfide oxidoreductase YuxK
MRIPLLPKPIVYFDGTCNLCDRSVNFILKQDKQKRFLFAPLQSAAGQQAILATGGQPTLPVGSVLLYYRGKYYTRSTAALYVLWLLGGWWRVSSALFIIPAFLRNVVYNYVAANRHKWFGTKETCLVPTADVRERFVS